MTCVGDGINKGVHRCFISLNVTVECESSKANKKLNN